MNRSNMSYLTSKSVLTLIQLKTNTIVGKPQNLGRQFVLGPCLFSTKLHRSIPVVCVWKQLRNVISFTLDIEVIF